MIKKKCKTCGVVKKINDFYQRTGSLNSVLYHGDCKKCMMKKNTERKRKKNRPQPVVDLKNERWEWVRGYKNYYRVSNFGRIKSVDRWILDSKGYKKLIFGILLNPSFDQNAYLKITLKKGNKSKTLRMNRLVGFAFVPNPNPRKFKYTNHKNGIRHDNRDVNLEWCDAEYNANYKYDVLGYVFPKGEKNKLSKMIVIIHLDKSEELVNGIAEASRRLGLGLSSIKRVLKGKYDTHKGYGFKYSNVIKMTA